MDGNPDRKQSVAPLPWGPVQPGCQQGHSAGGVSVRLHPFSTVGCSILLFTVVVK